MLGPEILLCKVVLLLNLGKMVASPRLKAVVFVYTRPTLIPGFLCVGAVSQSADSSTTGPVHMHRHAGGTGGECRVNATTNTDG